MKIQSIVLSMVLAGGTVGLIAPMAAPAAVVDLNIDVAPPPPRVEAPPPPRVGFVWAPGYWQWHGHHHVWHAGYWVREHRGAHWVPAHWDQNGPHYHFVPGHWDR
jgi:hypothetical protein